MASKRKHNTVTVQQKLEAIRELDKGVPGTTIARQLGVGKQTVSDWKRNRSQIEKWAEKCDSSAAKPLRKTLKQGDYEKTGEALYVWFSQVRSKGSPVTGPLLRKKALLFHSELQDGDSNFTASEGWMDRWKKRHGIRKLDISGEKLSAKPEDAAAFRHKLLNIMEQNDLSLDQVYNCDETGLNFKMLPSATLASREEASAPGHKMSKERVTLLACANASGSHKLPLVLVGKSKKPRALKNVSFSALPVVYKSQKSAWMDCSIFRDWFFNEFVPKVEKFLSDNGFPRKAILTLDNAPAHPNAQDLKSGDIGVLYFPPNVTSLIQPMDQGVLECLKRKFRSILLQFIVDEIDNSGTVQSALKQITMKDVVYWAAESWDCIKIETLQKSWRKLLQAENVEADNHEAEESVTCLVSHLRNALQLSDATESDVTEWMEQDEQNEITDAEIVSQVNQGTDVPETPESDDEDEGPTDKVSHADGFQALDRALKYLEQQQDTTPAEVMQVRRLRDQAAKKCLASKRQTRMTDYILV